MKQITPAKWKRWLCLLLLAAGLMNLCPAFAASEDRYIYTENGGSLNMRNRASKHGTVLERIPAGTKVSLEKEGSTWSLIKYDNRSGYVMTRYLRKPGSSKPQESFKKVSKTMYVNTGNKQPLHLRKKDSRSSRSLGVFKNGTPVSVSGVTSTWAKVSVSGQEGYMMLSYLSEKSPESTGTTDGGTYVQGSGSVQIYQEPDFSSPVLMNLPGGSRVSAHGRSDSWTKVVIQGTLGYVRSSALTTEKPNTDKGTTGIIINPNGASYVNLRSSPGIRSEYNVLAHIKVNTEVRVIGKKGSWRKIVWGDLVGYIHGSFLESN